MNKINVLLQCNLDHPDLVYPDSLNSAKYINKHAQRACPMIFWGCGSRSMDAAETPKLSI